MIQYRIFVVDDEEIIRNGIALVLETEYLTTTFPDAETVLNVMQEMPPDLVLLDIGLPGIDGIEALRRIKEHHPDVLVIMITAYEDIDTVVTAMKLGAYDYVVKPIVMDDLEITIRNALDTIRLRKEVQALQEKYLSDIMPCFIAESNAIQDVIEFVNMAAQSPDTPILVLGETGTGKELIASAIHYRSPNFKGPFIVVNCAAIPKDLIESELFGYEKGAFSGAGATGKKGLIEKAAGGTLFLDEVGDLSLEAQAKLLRFLESGEFYRVGGTTKLQINTRVVSATNKDLKVMMAGDLFRRDLFYRLGVIIVSIPSLNERPEDIIPLAQYFLLQFNDKFNKKIERFSTEAQRALKTHRWTGNIRELKNMIERAVLMVKGPNIEPKDLCMHEEFTDREGSVEKGCTMPPLTSAGVDLSAVEKSLTKYYINEALRITQGNESQAARLLRLNHHTFRYRRKKLESQ